MNDSESKTLNWTGNFYHTFEGIIPDVTDINIQGTFRYVENQVNNVGGNFKKFCSVVVQDLFPLLPNSVESEARSSIPGENSTISVDPIKNEAKEVTQEENSVVTTADNSEINVGETCSDCVIKQSSLVAINDVEANKSELKLAKSDENHETCSVGDDVFSAPTNENSEMSGEESEEDVIEPFEELLVDAKHETESVVSTVSGLETLPSSEGNFGNVLPHDTTESDVSTPKSEISPLSPSPVELLSPTPALALPLIKDIAMEKQVDLSSSNLSLRSKDDSSVVNAVVDLGMETINLHDDEVKLEDSCVFIDDTVLHAVACRARKLGSYKKKIQDIFTSKRRLTKEYEQLAIWYGDSDLSSKPNPLDSQTRHGCDSDWELL